VSTVFQVLEIFRPAQRKGPVVVGTAPSVGITVGTTLTSIADPAITLEVIAVDFPTPKFQAEGKLAVVVRPDPGDQLQPGLTFRVSSPA
jgi:hypothetical protein